MFGLVFAASPAHTLTRYHLRVRAVPSISQRLVFGLTCSDSANALTILDATHDGSGRVTSTVGGPPVGKLLSGANPADTTTLVGGAFYSEIDLLLETITQFDCDLDLSEQAPQGDTAPTEFALYYLNENEDPRVPTQDPFGTNTIAALDVTGVPGGELFTFSPLTFLAPDTLLVDGTVVGVSMSHGSGDRVRFSSIAPNPAHHRALFAFDLPSAGQVEIRVYDVAGRLLAEPIKGQRPAGPGSVDWEMRSRSGVRLPPGFYIAELRFGRQSVVRRFIVTR
jgi:hypothetical protein